jgi:outer membrane protein TolC
MTLFFGLLLAAGAGAAPQTPPPRPVPHATVTPVPNPAPDASPLPTPYTPSIQNLPVPAPVTLPAPEFVPADVPNRPLSLAEAIRVALVHQSNVTIALAAVEAAQGRTQQVKAAAQPSLTLGATGTTLISQNFPGGGGGFSTTTGSTSGTTTTSGGAANTATSASGTTVGGTGVGVAAANAVVSSSNFQSGGSTGLSSSSTNGYTFTASARQLIFDFNHTRDLIAASLAAERSAFANLSRVQQDLVLQVKQGYFQLIQNVRLVEVQETNLRNQQEHLALAEARYRAGLGLPSDVVRAQTAVASAIFSLNQAQNTASISRVNLALLLGIDPRTPIDVVMEGITEAPIDTSDPNALFRYALEKRPEVVQAIANLQQSQYSLSAAKTNNAPSLSASLNYFTRGQQVTNFNIDTFTGGLSVSWPIFDGGFTSGQIRQARANELSSQAQLIAARQNVMSDVAQAYLNLKTAEQRLVTSASEVQNAEESVRLVTGRYRAGLGTFLDVLDAEAALVTAQTNQVNAQSAVDQARAALARAMGLPLADVPDAGTEVPPHGNVVPVPWTEREKGTPIPVHPGPPSDAPGAPAARGHLSAPSPGAPVTPPPPGPGTPTIPGVRPDASPTPSPAPGQ